MVEQPDPAPGLKISVPSFVGWAYQAVLRHLTAKRPPYLVVVDCPDPAAQGQRFDITTEGVLYLVGRSRAGCHLSLKDDLLSRTHFSVCRRGDQVFVRDADSTNGVLLDGRRIPAREDRRLRDGNEIRAGQSRLRFVDQRSIPIRSASDLFSSFTRSRLRSPRAPAAPGPKDAGR